ncbi:MAG: RNA polymerase sigma factor, partial [Myxococcota bacterium]
VFLRVIRARRRYRPSARFSTWLYRIAFNLCANERERRSSGERSLETLAGGAGEAGIEGSVPEPSTRLEKEDLVRAVRAAIAALPERQRMALILARYDELPYVEIAQVLDTTEKAIKSMIHRAREKLRASLAPYLQEEPA